MKIHLEDLGVIDYQDAWTLQTAYHNALVDKKSQGLPTDEDQYFLVCEHPPVYTLGKSGSKSHLLLSDEALQEHGYAFYQINRGGDITHHGPGQIVGYPILDLSLFSQDVGWYVRSLEEVVIRTLADYGIQGERIDKYTGVWLKGLPAKKICAIGVHLSRWVTLHGFAFNVNNDIRLFDHIIPCGIQESDKSITSLSNELGKEIALEEVKERIAFHFGQVFHVELLRKQSVK